MRQTQQDLLSPCLLRPPCIASGEEVMQVPNHAILKKTFLKNASDRDWEIDRSHRCRKEI